MEESYEMLTSRYDMVAAHINLDQLWLPAPIKPVNIPAWMMEDFKVLP